MHIFTDAQLRDIDPSLTAIQRETMQYYDGDHWQQGNGWIGPRAAEDSTLYGALMLEVQRMFTSQNVVKEIVDRQVAGMVGIPPDWTVTVDRELAEKEEPTVEEQALIDQATELLRKWWTSNQGLVSVEDQLWTPYKILRNALTTGLLIGRAPLRIFVPTDRWTTEEDQPDNPEATSGDQLDSVALGQFAGGVVLPILTEDEAIESIFLHFPAPDQAEVHIDHSTLRPIGVYVASLRQGASKEYELHSLEKGVAVVQKYVDGKLESTNDINLHNHPLMFELGLPELVSDSIRSQQRALNMALTMMGRNSVQAGFLERIILNGQLPGREVTNPDTGEVTFIPEGLTVGPGMTTFIPGLPITDAEGNKTYSNPQVVYRDPVDPSTFIKSVSHLYSNILHEVHQEHVLLSDTDVSGESRKQSRADFETTLNDQQESVRGAVQWLMETTMHLVGYLIGKPDLFSELKVQVETHTYLGPLSGPEQDSIIKLTESSLLSKRTGRVRLGVRDVDAEERQIALEEEASGARDSNALADAMIRARETNGNSNNAANDPDAQVITDGTEQSPDNAQLNERIVE